MTTSSNPMHKIAAALLCACLAAMAACSDEPAPVVDPQPEAEPEGGEPEGGEPEGGEPEGGEPEGGEPEADGPPAPGEYGAPCEDDQDCTSRICVNDGEGGICSQFCLEGCPDFFPDREAFCRADASQGGEVAFVCFPNQNLLCQPCTEDAQCDGGLCIDTDDGLVCGRACVDDQNCPQDFNCVDFGDRGRSCAPANNSCSCNRDTQGITRVCERANELGACRGQERCDFVQGWIDCDAAEAEAEICDGVDQNCNAVADDGITAMSCAVENEFGACRGTAVCQGPEGFECLGISPEAEACDRVDNDCDELIDEDFKDDQGRFGRLEHCGGCNITCEGRFSFAAEIACDAERETPTCVIRECVEGYRLVGDALCVPLTDVTCQPCNANDDCLALSPGAACVTLGDPRAPETLARVCGRDCSPEGLFGVECDPGFVCQTFTDQGQDPVQQCVPGGGTCFCQDNPDGFTVPCTAADPDDPQITCRGSRGCEGDRFGDCVLPADTCNGLDDDCDGTIDNAFRDPDTGRYALDPAHCGRCNRGCGDLTFANAQSVCDTAANTPVCVMQCLDGFVDLFNGIDDGCECQRVADDDTPDGADDNCDTIDGNVELGVFVSKIGRIDGDGSLADPVLTIQEGLDIVRTSNGAKRDVYVALGVYSENIVLANGVNVYGGYSLDFLERDIVNNQTTLFGVPLDLGHRGTVTAVNINRPTILDGFSIYGLNAAFAGESSYTVFIQDSTDALTISSCALFAGNGANGLRGDAGQNGTLGSAGASGINAITVANRNCANAPRFGGTGGQNTCGNTNVSGGAGGAAACPQTQRINGQIPCTFSSTDCRNSCTTPPCSPLPPAQGVGASGQGPVVASGGAPTYDRWTDQGECTLCGLFPALNHRGNPGQDGANGNAGAAGPACSDPFGQVDADGNWTAIAGGNGNNGGHGAGGGGGSAGSGFDVVNNAAGDVLQCRDTIGGSGGGGGSGGCRGTGGRTEATNEQTSKRTNK